MIKKFLFSFFLLLGLFGVAVPCASAAYGTSIYDYPAINVESSYPTSHISPGTEAYLLNGEDVLLPPETLSLPAGSVITGGTQYEEAWTNMPGPYYCDAFFFPITSAWTPSTVTWGTRPSYASGTEVNYTIACINGTPAPPPWDIGPVAHYWNSNPCYGIYETLNGGYGYDEGFFYNESSPYPEIGISYEIPPTTVTVSNVTQTSATVTWNGAGDGIAEYSLSRNGTVVYAGTGSTYTDTGLSPGTSYTYIVTLYYTVPGGYSDSGKTFYSSTPISTSTTTPIVPAPGAFTTPSYTQTSIALSWGTNGLSGTFYVLTRNGAQIYSGTNLTYTDSGLATGTAYNYSVETGITGVAGTFYSTAKTASYATLPGNPTVTGACGLQAWSSTAGTGYVTLSWPAVTGATGYHLYVWDGYAYRQFNLGNVLSWDSRVALIYPAASELTQQGNVTVDLFNTSGTGLNLQDNPESLYRTMNETSYINTTNYFFWIAPYDASGENSTQVNQPSGSNYYPSLPTATDTTAPTVGAATALSTFGLTTTYTTAINLTLPNATDSQSGVYTISVSNDGTTYTNEYTASIGSNGGTSVNSYTGTTVSWNVTVGAGTKTIYVKVSDAVGNSTITTCNIAYVLDSTAPTVTMQINSGATSTTSTPVTLTFTALDPVYSNSQLTMRLSNNGSVWTGWQAYTTSMSWDITNSSYGGTAVPGVKTVWVQVADPAPCIGYIQGTIGYNSNPPTGAVTVVGGTSGTYNGAAVQFTSSDNPTLSMNYTNASQIMFDTGAGIWGSWQTYASSMQIATVKSSGVCKIRVEIQDVYGVTGTPQTITLVIVPTPPTISTLAGWGGATCSTTTSVSLELDAAGAIPGQLQYRYQINGGSWTSLANLTGNQITVSGLSIGANTINVGVDDVAGNETKKSVTIFYI